MGPTAVLSRVAPGEIDPWQVRDAGGQESRIWSKLLPRCNKKISVGLRRMNRVIVTRNPNQEESLGFGEKLAKGSQGEKRSEIIPSNSNISSVNHWEIHGGLLNTQSNT